VSLKKFGERAHGEMRSMYSFEAYWDCRSLHNEHCWRRRSYVIIFRLRRQLDSSYRGCFPCVVFIVHPTLSSFRNILLVVFLVGGELMYRFLRAFLLRLVGLELACICKRKMIDKEYVNVSSG